MGLVLSATTSDIRANDDRHLDAWYATYNHEYFQDELPKTTVITRNLADDRFMAQTFYENGYYHIAINPRLNSASTVEKMTLLHEDCHIYLIITHDVEFNDHGNHWQKCMRDLADRGAFGLLW